ncbi:LytR/AlgR family response regulator transcription factor [Larkinella terrae]|uniref:Response regulator n=1 Tax=Larkinella terrae TaxID=2025311 RepID=A0A7K0EK02_9BACT|nr:LytTR family DNA-binding domain-containing protein [Larkinella terrae]MRS62114.1 response regulator [Larkinella terrae]
MIRCLVVDDERLALEVMENYIEKIPFLQLVQLCSSPLQALQVLSQTPVDLLLVDIEMPELTGLQFLRTLKDPPFVILTTAYQEFALEGFAVNAIDYLLKPIPFERFLSAIHKVQQRMGASTREAPLPGPPEVAVSESIFIKSESRTVRVDIADILFAESRKDYVLIHTQDRKWITQLTLSRLEEKLPPSHFVRIHRSFIVAIHKMDSIDRNRVEIGGKYLPIGDFYRENLLKRIG